MASLSWSHTLSGCPAATDSDVEQVRRHGDLVLGFSLEVELVDQIESVEGCLTEFIPDGVALCEDLDRFGINGLHPEWKTMEHRVRIPAFQLPHLSRKTFDFCQQDRFLGVYLHASLLMVDQGQAAAFAQRAYRGFDSEADSATHVEPERSMSTRPSPCLMLS
jgi:hypothetical protein